MISSNSVVFVRGAYGNAQAVVRTTVRVSGRVPQCLLEQVMVYGTGARAQLPVQSLLPIHRHAHGGAGGRFCRLLALESVNDTTVSFYRKLVIACAGHALRAR